MEKLEKYKIDTTLKNEIDCLIIKIGNIDELSYQDEYYTKKLIKLDLFEIVHIETTGFANTIANHLQVNNYDLLEINIKKDLIGEEPNYIYEMLYIDLENNNKYHIDNNENQFANLINYNFNQIYSHAIILKTYLPSHNNDIELCNITKDDIERLLYFRGNSKLVIFDGFNIDEPNDQWYEKALGGDLEKFAIDFFDGNYYHKLEIPFLMHNINIWYLCDENGYDLCNKIINKKIERCIWFSMRTNEYRENLSLDEVKKIIFLSNKLENYETPKEYQLQEIIYNRYRVLEQIYNIISIQDVITFLNNSIDEMPIYSQRRLLDCIYSSFIINNNFPKELFSEKIQHILKTIYDIDISVKKIQKKISSNKNINDIFLYNDRKIFFYKEFRR